MNLQLNIPWVPDQPVTRFHVTYHTDTGEKYRAIVALQASSIFPQVVSLTDPIRLQVRLLSGYNSNHQIDLAKFAIALKSKIASPKLRRYLGSLDAACSHANCTVLFFQRTAYSADLGPILQGFNYNDLSETPVPTGTQVSEPEETLFSDLEEVEGDSESFLLRAKNPQNKAIIKIVHRTASSISGGKLILTGIKTELVILYNCGSELKEKHRRVERYIANQVTKVLMKYAPKVHTALYSQNASVRLEHMHHQETPVTGKYWTFCNLSTKEPS